MPMILNFTNNICSEEVAVKGLRVINTPPNEE